MKSKEINSETTSFAARGTRVSIKFFLNKKLKPKIENGEKFYPVYARVICKKQVCDFRVEVIPYAAQIDLDEALSDKRISARSDSMHMTLSMVEDEVNEVIKLLRPFEREKFSLAKLPKILRLRDEYSWSYFSVTIVKSMELSLTKSGYEDLAKIIDWENLNPHHIIDCLLKLQYEKKISQFPLTKKSKFGFNEALLFVSGLPIKNDSYIDDPERFQKAFELMVNEKLVTSRSKPDVILAFSYAIEFVNLAFKLSAG